MTSRLGAWAMQQTGLRPLDKLVLILAADNAGLSGEDTIVSSTEEQLSAAAGVDLLKLRASLERLTRLRLLWQTATVDGPRYLIAVKDGE